jgi:hypothetical protein
MDRRRPPGTRARGPSLSLADAAISSRNIWSRSRIGTPLGWDVVSFDWRSQGESRGHIKGGHLDSFDPLVADAASLLKEVIETSEGPHVRDRPFHGRTPAASRARRSTGRRSRPQSSSRR